MIEPTQTVRSERHGSVLVITLDRPDVRNAVDPATARQIAQAMDLLDADDSLFIGIITGAGGTFCAGADLKAAARGERSATAERGGFGMFRKPSRKPLIAAVEGYAIGGGMEMCLACDLIVASRTARFGLPEVRSGVLAIGGGLFRLPRRIPYHLAMELALSAELRDAEFFQRQGLVNRIVEPGEALAHALAWAEQLLANSPLAMAASKQILWESSEWTEDEAWDRQMAIARPALDSEDRKEGLKAFAAKRKPVWQGR